MAERVVAPRKSQLFLHSIIPVTRSYDEVLTKKLKKGKFPWTITGYMQLAGIIAALPALAMFISTSSCEESPEWRTYLFPSATGIFIFFTLVMYMVFALGLSLKKPGFFVAIDIIGIIVVSLLEIGSALATMFTCRKGTVLKNVPESIGIGASAIMIASCVALILMYRYVEFEEEFVVTSAPVTSQRDKRIQLPRKSVAA